MPWYRRGLLAAHLLDFRLQTAGDMRGYELANIAAENRDFTHNCRRHKHEPLARGQKHRFNVRVKITVHAGELEFVLEIRRRTQSAHHYLRPMFLNEFHQQSGEADHCDVAAVSECSLRHRNPFLERKEWLLGTAVGHRDYHRVEYFGGAAHQIFVSERDRIESARIYGFKIHGPPTSSIDKSPHPRGLCAIPSIAAAARAPAALRRGPWRRQPAARPAQEALATANRHGTADRGIQRHRIHRQRAGILTHLHV